MAPSTCSHATTQKELNTATEMDSPQEVLTESLSTVKFAIKQKTSESPPNSPRPSERRRVAPSDYDSITENKLKKTQLGLQQVCPHSSSIFGVGANLGIHCRVTPKEERRRSSSLFVAKGQGT